MTKKILIVDDSPVELLKVRNVLHEAGFDTVTASNGKEAVAKAQSDGPAMIFMDVVMPDMDGYEACRQLKGNPVTSKIPIVIVSSKNQKADQMWALMQGAKALIGKPASAEDILAAAKTYS